jgi:hypothetical protein
MDTYEGRGTLLPVLSSVLGCITEQQAPTLPPQHTHTLASISTFKAMNPNDSNDFF